MTRRTIGLGIKGEDVGVKVVGRIGEDNVKGLIVQRIRDRSSKMVFECRCGKELV